MAKWRQTLLPFTSKIPLGERANPPDSSSSRNSNPPRPAPQLPTEVWNCILEPLGTFPLKKFRLVCREWSVLGAERLYHTAYLNAYESSWSGLISISTSRHASLVKKIVWSLLELPDECLDGEIWASRYRNLLWGLRHVQILHFRRAFEKVYQDRNSFLRSSKIESISSAINNLPNCHEIVLSDDNDLETNCKDSYFRAGICSDPNILKKPTTWALRPRIWDRTREGVDALRAVEDVFQALRGCHFITRLAIDLWAKHWDGIHETSQYNYEYIRDPPSGRSIRKTVHYPNITELDFRLRFCEFRWEWFDWVGESKIQTTLDYAISCTDSFPELQELSFAPSFSEPEPEYIEYILRWETDDDDNVNTPFRPRDAAFRNTLLRPGVTASELVSHCALEFGLSPTVLNCAYAELTPTVPPLPKLRTLQISNTTLDMRLLLYWLASHRQLPTSSISLHLLETTILYGLDPELFLEALALLNVRISYDRHSTFHSPVDSFTQNTMTPRLDCYLINSRKATTVRRWLKVPLHLPGDELGYTLNPFSLFHRKAKQNSAEFTHRPDEFEQFITEHTESEYISAQRFSYAYRISLDKQDNGVWEWVRLGPYSRDSTGSQDQKRTATLVTLTWIPGCPSEEGWGDDERESQIVSAAIYGMNELIQEAKAQQEIEDQELLWQYEMELLGLDLVDVEA